jgi:4-hydroxy-tetrahydrodipicolinate synthase
MTSASPQPQGGHLVGSVPLQSAEDVFRTVTGILNGRLRRIPDGETGVRSNWIGWQSDVMARVPQLAILVGHEPDLPRLMRAGGAGTICGVGNLYPALVRALLSPGVTPADEKRMTTFLEIAFRVPFLAGFKAILAEQTRNPGWRSVRPPLLPLADAARQSLLAALHDAGLTIGGADQ